MNLGVIEPPVQLAPRSSPLLGVAGAAGPGVGPFPIQAVSEGENPTATKRGH